MCNNTNTLLNRALAFATDKHKGQLRKYTNVPYITHPKAVSNIVAEVTKDGEMLAAALLHDTVEDTDATLEDIGNNFGSRVMMLVECLTDVSKPGDGNRKVRKSIDRAHTAKAHRDAKTIKLADLIHNTTSIVKYDKKFAKIYMREKQLLLGVLKEGNTVLYGRAEALVKAYYVGRVS